MKKRILRVIGSVSPATGGPVEGVIRSAAAMAARGYETDVATLDDPSAPWVKDFPLRLIPTGPGIGRYGYNTRLASWIAENSQHYGLVIVQGIWNYSSVATWRALRRSPVPYVVFTHGMMDPWFRKENPLKHCAKQIYWWLLEGRVLKSARLVLFTAEEERRLARNSFLGHAYRERVVAYGTSDVAGDADAQIAAFRAQVPALGARRFLLFLSRIHPKKGCDLLLKAFAATASRNADIDLVIAGPDAGGWSADLKAMAEKAGIASRVHWPGPLYGDAKWGAFRAAEAFVLPSHQENFGIVVAEAMACGTPVLISNKINIFREVESCGAGLVANDDEEGTRELLERFFEAGESFKRERSAQARSGFLAHFEIGAAAGDLERVVEEVQGAA